MNDSLDLRKRIIKMRESNNLVVTSSDQLDKNLSSKSVNDITEKKSEIPEINKTNVNDKTKEIETTKSKNDKLLTNPHNEKSEDNNIKSFVSNNEAQFLMLANKFNEAVEVILELSQKVEKLERSASQKTNMQNDKVNSSSFLNFKIFVLILLIPSIVIGLFTLPFDFLLIKTIILDILTSL